MLTSDGVIDVAINVSPRFIDRLQQVATTIRQGEDVAAELLLVGLPGNEIGLDQTRCHGAHAGRGKVEFARKINLRSLFHAAESVQDAGLAWLHPEGLEPKAQPLFNQMTGMEKEVKSIVRSLHAYS